MVSIRLFVITDVFFFSSRRRHTRLQGDWSSDVCSSDLEGLSPIDNPSVEVAQLEPGKPLKYKATVVVKPDVDLGDYKAHGAAVEPKPPADDEIVKTIDAMRDQHAQLKSVERESRAGDIVMVDIDVNVDGLQLPPFARNA